MGTDQIVTLGRTVLVEVAMLISPILALVIAVSFVINVVQVLTSLQDQTLSSVPRLLTTGVALFILMPWMWQHLGLFTVRLLSDFHGVLR